MIELFLQDQPLHGRLIVLNEVKLQLLTLLMTGFKSGRLFVLFVALVCTCLSDIFLVVDFLHILLQFADVHSV